MITQGNYLPICPILKHNNVNNRTLQHSSSSKYYHKSNFVHAASPTSSENSNRISHVTESGRILAKMVSACVGSIITTMVVTLFSLPTDFLNPQMGPQ